MANMLFANNCNTTLNGGISAIATSMVVASATGFPTPTGSQYFYCTLADAATQTTIEIVKVTAVSGTTFTIVRGQDGTTGIIFASGAVVSLRLVRANLDDFPKLDEINTFTGLITASGGINTPTVQATNSAGLSLKNSGGTTQISMGAGGGNNVTVSAPIAISPANGLVNISPTGTGSVTVNPATAGTINNMSIGATTVSTGAFTTLSSTSDATVNGLTVGKGGSAISGNTVLGVNALANNVSGYNNVAIGSSAGNQNSTGQNNIYLGLGAGQNNTVGNNIVAIGTNALLNTVPASAGFVGLVGIGAGVLQANTVGVANIAIGGFDGSVQPAMYANTDGAFCVAIGSGALRSHNHGFNNTAVGYNTSQALTNGYNNASYGTGALNGLTTGTNSSAFGANSLASATGDSNTGLGFSAGSAITSGRANSIIGSYTGAAAPISATGSNYVVLSDGDGNIKLTAFPTGGVSIGNTTDPGATNLSVTGSASAARFVPISSTVPTNGMYLGATNSLTFSTATTERMRIDDNGSLLVGTNVSLYGYAGTPSFELNGTDSATIGLKKGGVAGSYISHGGSLNIVNTTANKLGLYTSNTERIRIFATGGVSIGNTTDPSTGGLNISGLFFPQQATTAAAPAYVKGGIYFDTTLNKLRVGGATAWETITSV